MDVHLRDLRYFVAVAEELDLARAAERLLVSQQVVTRQLGRLEADLRTALVERDPTSVSLTAAGRALLEHARLLLGDWDAAQRAVADGAASVSAVIRVGLHTSADRGVVARLRAHLEQRRPGWRIETVGVAWDDPSCGLAEGRTDVAVMWLPVPAGYRHAIVADEPRRVAVWRSHPLAAREVLHVREIVDEPFVTQPGSTDVLHDDALATRLRLGATPRVLRSAADAGDALDAVAARTAVALVAEGDVADFAGSGVVTIPVTGLPTARLAVVWRADDPRDVVHDLVTAIG